VDGAGWRFCALARRANNVAVADDEPQLSGGMMTGRISLREVKESDLHELFAHQRDPVANQMAAFPAREREAFIEHWRKILADEGVIKRTILFGSDVAGSVVCFEQSGKRLIGYWLGRSFWGRGIASQAVSDFISLVPTRPLHAYVAKRNAASMRVLEKCGFKVSGESRSAATTGGEVVDEFIYSLLD
jgi:RimJ/RimL family protein N-acetyltransferase